MKKRLKQTHLVGSEKRMVSFRLEEELINEIKEEAKKRNVPYVDVFRMAILREIGLLDK